MHKNDVFTTMVIRQPDNLTDYPIVHAITSHLSNDIFVNLQPFACNLKGGRFDPQFGD